MKIYHIIKMPWIKNTNKMATKVKLIKNDKNKKIRIKIK